jgi:hypothetical protein
MRKTHVFRHLKRLALTASPGFACSPRKVEVYNSFYLAEPVSKMPYLHWETELKSGNHELLESDHGNMSELFLDYFKKRWDIEKEKLYAQGNQDVHSKDFIHAPAAAREKCAELVIGM